MSNETDMNKILADATKFMLENRELVTEMSVLNASVELATELTEAKTITPTQALTMTKQNTYGVVRAKETLAGLGDCRSACAMRASLAEMMVKTMMVFQKAKSAMEAGSDGEADERTFEETVKSAFKLEGSYTGKFDS